MDLILPFSAISHDHKEIIGEKAYSLYQLSSHDLPVCDGFVITTLAQNEFLKSNQLSANIKKQLEIYDLRDPQSLLSATKQIHSLIIRSKLPTDITESLFEAYDHLTKKNHESRFSIRTSLIDSENKVPHSLFLNVVGEHTIAEMVKELYANLITPHYLAQHTSGTIPKTAILVQRMFDSVSSGFLHTIDPYTNNKRLYVIEAVWGLAEILSNQDMPKDKYCLDKQTLTINVRKTYPQHIEQVIENHGVKEVAIPFSKQLLPKLNDAQIVQLAHYCKKLNRLAVHPQTIEWGFDGDTFTFFQSQDLIEINDLTSSKSTRKLSLPILLEGQGDNPGVGTGLLTRSSIQEQSFARAIVILEEYSREILEKAKDADGIINVDSDNQREIKFFCQQQGIPLVHISSASVPYLVGGKYITIDGSTGLIYKGSVNEANIQASYEREVTIEPVDLIYTQMKPISTKTAIYVDIHSPNNIIDIEMADGVCMIRGETLLSSLQNHPFSYFEHNNKKMIQNTLLKALTPYMNMNPTKPLFYKFSDLMSADLYTYNLSHSFEIVENIPLFGNRGSWRHVQDSKLFKEELLTLGKLTNKTNINVIIPFIRIHEELNYLHDILKKEQAHNYNLWLSLESPANCINLPQYVTHQLTGVVVDIKSLTMFSLGVDPNASKTKDLYNEFDPSILWILKHLTHYCQEKKLKVVFSNFHTPLDQHRISMLLKMGVSGVSVIPTQILETKKLVAALEKNV